MANDHSELPNQSDSGLSNQILNSVADVLPPHHMRHLGTSLLKLADALDQDWQPPSGKGIFRWPNALSRIERDAYILAERAQLEFQRRRKREKFVPFNVIGEQGWDMLLELFQQFAGNAKVTTKSLCIAASCPTSTGLRYIDLLEEEGLIERSAAAHDRRITFVELTDKGVLSVGNYLSEL